MTSQTGSVREFHASMSNMYKHGPCALACPKVHTLYTRVLTRCTLSSFSFTEAYVSLIVPPFELSTYKRFPYSQPNVRSLTGSYK